jgi:hypothetical protein
MLLPDDVAAIQQEENGMMTKRKVGVTRGRFAVCSRLHGRGEVLVYG